ncbi:MAG: hypothetical protein GY893_04635, partial [bacterium]|nr:hypothetical protein [bacterium]
MASSGISGVNPLPSIDLGNITTICDDGSTPLTLDAGNAGATFAWTPNGETSRTITANAANTYEVTVTDGNNCSSTESITITETPCGPVCASDNDNDGICDDVDLDDDNDGILDTEECIDEAASWDFETPVVGAGNNNQGQTFQGWTLVGSGWINLIHPPYGNPATTAAPQTASAGGQYVEVGGSGNFERLYAVTETGPLTIEIDFAAWNSGGEQTKIQIFEVDGTTLVAESNVVTTNTPADWFNAWEHTASV